MLSLYTNCILLYVINIVDAHVYKPLCTARESSFELSRTSQSIVWCIHTCIQHIPSSVRAASDRVFTYPSLQPATANKPALETQHQLVYEVAHRRPLLQPCLKFSRRRCHRTFKPESFAQKRIRILANEQAHSHPPTSTKYLNR